MRTCAFAAKQMPRLLEHIDLAKRLPDAAAGDKAKVQKPAAD